MCEDAVAEYACADDHEQRGESRTRLSHIVRCPQAINSESGAACANRTEAHDWQDDDSSTNCPECRGDTPPVTP